VCVCVCVRESALPRCCVRCPGHHCVLTNWARVPLCSESTVRTMQEALDEAGKYKDRCEALTARMQLVEAALEKARAAEAAAAEAAEKEAGTAAEAAAVAQLEQERADATVGAEEEEEEEVVVWTCEVCTYINEDPLIHMCEMCGVLKG
jgi:rubrerythrin